MSFEQIYVGREGALGDISLPSLMAFAKTKNLVLVGKQGDPVPREVDLLVQMYKDHEFTMADLAQEIQAKRRVHTVFTPYNLGAVQQVAEKVTLVNQAIEYTDASGGLLNLPCKAGVIDWTKEPRADCKVNVSRALLAHELSQDAHVQKGKVIAIHRQETSTFGKFQSSSQTVFSAEMIGKRKLGDEVTSSGHDLSARLYDGIKNAPFDQVKQIAHNIAKTDPPGIRADSKYAEVTYKAMQRQRGKDREVEIKGMVRDQGAGIFSVKTPIAQKDLFPLMKQWDAHVSSAKDGGGSMIPDFYYGIPLSKGLMKYLSALSVMKQLADKKCPVALTSGDSSLAAFLSHNCGRAVGFTSEQPMSRADVLTAIKEKKIFSYSPGKVRESWILYVIKQPDCSSEKDGLLTHQKARLNLLNKIREQPPHTVMPVHSWAVDSFLSRVAGDETDYIIKDDETEIVCSFAPFLGLHKKQFLIANSPDMFEETITGNDMNMLLKLFLLNAITFRYHKKSFSSIIETWREGFIMYPFKKLEFSFLRPEQVNDLQLVELDTKLLGASAWNEAEAKFNMTMAKAVKDDDLDSVEGSESSDEEGSESEEEQAPVKKASKKKDKGKAREKEPEPPKEGVLGESINLN